MIYKAIAYIAIKRDPLATMILFIIFPFLFLLFKARCVAQLAQIDILRTYKSCSGPTGTLYNCELSQTVLITLITRATHHVQFLALTLTAENFIAGAWQDGGESMLERDR